jgi:hypothetical protein
MIGHWLSPSRTHSTASASTIRNPNSFSILENQKALAAEQSHRRVLSDLSFRRSGPAHNNPMSKDGRKTTSTAASSTRGAGTSSIPAQASLLANFGGEVRLTFPRRRLSVCHRGMTAASSVVSLGGSSCVLCMRSASRKRRKSNARSCKAMHDCAVVNSASIARSYGRSKRLSILRLQLDAASELPPTSFQASARHLTNQCSSSSTRYLVDSCF